MSSSGVDPSLLCPAHASLVRLPISVKLKEIPSEKSSLAPSLRKFFFFFKRERERERLAAVVVVVF